MTTLTATTIVAYLPGGMLSADLLGKRWHGANIRALGLGNVGAASAAEAFGARAGAMVVDATKGAAAAGLANGTQAAGELVEDPIGGLLLDHGRELAQHIPATHPPKDDRLMRGTHTSDPSAPLDGHPCEQCGRQSRPPGRRGHAPGLA
jgi:hypothetical protein